MFVLAFRAFASSLFNSSGSIHHSIGPPLLAGQATEAADLASKADVSRTGTQ
jgi:hypothetical protein